MPPLPPKARLIGQPGDAANVARDSVSTAMLSFAAKSNGLCSSWQKKGKSAVPNKADDIDEPVANDNTGDANTLFDMIDGNAV